MGRRFLDFRVKLRGKRINSLFARSFHGRANFSLPSKLLWKHKSHFSPEKGDGKSECEIPTRKRGGHFAHVFILRSTHSAFWAKCPPLLRVGISHSLFPSPFSGEKCDFCFHRSFDGREKLARPWKLRAKSEFLRFPRSFTGKSWNVLSMGHRDNLLLGDSYREVADYVGGQYNVPFELRNVNWRLVVVFIICHHKLLEQLQF